MRRIDAWEKRNIADAVPVWEPGACIQCGQCAFVYPHGVIRAKYYDAARLAAAPDTFKAAPINERGFPQVKFSLQFYTEDCTGCGLCVEACPAQNAAHPPGKAINMHDKLPLREAEHANLAFFESLPVNDRARIDFANVRGVQFLEPLFAFSGACAGCGETPYLKLLSQLFGDRAQIANATGCSSINGGNLPVTPWSKNQEGHVRRGRIRCSRIMRSSGSAFGSPPISIWRWRKPCYATWLLPSETSGWMPS